MREELSQRIRAAAGGVADLLIKNVNVVDLFSSTVERTNVAIKSGCIAGIGTLYTEAEATYEFADMYLIPGLIDAHMHLESSFLTPRHFAQAVVPHGTTACVLDPHEIANVAGVKGIRWLMERSRGLPVDFFFMAPSCVPATHLETSGAELTADDVEELLDLEQCLGLGEVMNFPGVIAADEGLLDKIARTLRRGKRVDGHAPGLSGMDLNAYLSAGVETDHECTSSEEAHEKLTKGMRIMIREGSLAKNLADLRSLVKDENSRRFMFVSDDVNPEHLVVEGHMDRILRKALSYSMNPFMALKLTTINVYEHYGLGHRGGIAPGFAADLVVVKDLRDFRVEAVFKGGRPVYLEGELCVEFGRDGSDELRRSVNVKSPVDFGLRVGGQEAKVIGLVPDQLITTKLTRRVKSRNGQVVLDSADELLKLAVVDRHKGSGNVGLGLVSGFGLRKGAIGSSVAHDSHNVVIAGLNDEDMQCALQRIVDLQGGLVVVSEGEVLAELPLPIAGLLSDLPAGDVIARIGRLHDATKQLGSGLKDPFTALSFLSLAVIPELKLTDRGLVDVARFEFTSLWGNG
jgi:adenine deaminase